MTTSDRIPAAVLQILLHLDEFVRAGHGYEARGFHGWAGLAEIETATGVYAAAEALRRAYRAGRIVREDVSVPDAATPVWVYRITDTSSRDIADLRDEAHIPVPPPAQGRETRALMPSLRIAALDALRHAAEHPGEREWIPGEPEWRTSLELTGWLKDQYWTTGLDRVFMPGDVARLVTHCLAQDRAAPVQPHRKKPLILYRITVAGAALQTLSWQGPPAGAKGG